MEVIISAWFFGYLLMWCVLLLFICIEVEGTYCNRQSVALEDNKVSTGCSRSRKFRGPHENLFEGASKVKTQSLSLSKLFLTVSRVLAAYTARHT